MMSWITLWINGNKIQGDVRSISALLSITPQEKLELLKLFEEEKPASKRGGGGA
jgi:hypothetical protein